MTIQELIDKLNRYPDYFKEEAQVYVTCADEDKTYEITDIFDAMYHAIYLEVENIQKGE
jgi:hypothetical protein